MKVIDFSVYLDGGTVLIRTNKGNFAFDYRIKSDTKGKLYDGYPRKDNSNIIKKSKIKEKQILQALKDFNSDGSFYKNRINDIIEKLEKKIRL
jgi:hypothetical protein